MHVTLQPRRELPETARKLSHLVPRTGGDNAAEQTAARVEDAHCLVAKPGVSAP